MERQKLRCHAHKKNGEQCKRWAIIGGTVCPKHGGAAGHVKAAAKRRAAERQALAELQRMGEPVDVDPADALLGLVCEAAGNVAFLRKKVQGLDQRFVGRVYTEDPELIEAAEENDDELPSEPGPGIVSSNHLGDGAEHIYLRLYGEWMDKLAKYSKMAIEVGIAERQVRLAEQQGELIANLIRGLLRDLNIPASPETLAVVRKHLALVAA